MMFATWYFERINASLLLGEEFNGYGTVEEIELSKIEADIDKTDFGNKRQVPSAGMRVYKEVKLLCNYRECMRDFY